MSKIKRFSDYSLRWQITLVVIAMVAAPVAGMIYSAFFAPRIDRMLLEEKQQKLEQIGRYMDEGINDDVLKLIDKAAVGHNPVEIDAVQAALHNNMAGLAQQYREINMGYRIPSLGQDFSLLPPRRFSELRLEEGMAAALKAKKPYSDYFIDRRGGLFLHVDPIIRRGDVVALAWVGEMVPYQYAQNRSIRQTVFVITVLGLLGGLIGTIIIIRNTVRGVNRIKNGLVAIQKDFAYRLPPLPGEMGEIVQAINSMAQSLEEKAKLEEQLQRTERLAALGHLVSGVAHEMRNPMAIVKATVQLMQKQYKDFNEIQEYLDVIKEQIDRQNRIIEELLDFSRPAKPLWEEVSMVQLLNSVITFTRPYMDQHHVKLIENYNPDIPRVLADGEKLKQVFVNLIINAVQAMIDGGQLTISTWADDKWIYISFADTGPGVPDDDMENIFNPFYTTKYSGTGLGLAISHNIVAMHGGAISVSNIDAGGAMFTVSIPKERDDHVAENIDNR